MARARTKRGAAVAGIGLVLSLAACGKKAPLQLTDERAASRAPALRARVREGRVTLDFRVPAHRLFPEREEPWVLARILRQTVPSPEVVEAGAILETRGFAFEAPLSWSDQVSAPGSFVYRVEFRDAVRRRRALSEPLAVAWEQVPAAPSALTATGQLHSMGLAWAAPAGAGPDLTYRVYRREPPQEDHERATADPLAESTFVDVRVEIGREYCYVVRATLNARGLEVEGPASPEACSRPTSEDQPPQRPPVDAP